MHALGSSLDDSLAARKNAAAQVRGGVMAAGAGDTHGKRRHEKSDCVHLSNRSAVRKRPRGLVSGVVRSQGNAPPEQRTVREGDVPGQIPLLHEEQ